MTLEDFGALDSWVCVNLGAEIARQVLVFAVGGSCTCIKYPQEPKDN